MATKIGRPYGGGPPWKFVDGEIRSFSPFEPVGRTIAVVRVAEHGPLLASAPDLAARVKEMETEKARQGEVLRLVLASVCTVLCPKCGLRVAVQERDGEKRLESHFKGCPLNGAPLWAAFEVTPAAPDVQTALEDALEKAVALLRGSTYAHDLIAECDAALKLAGRLS